MRRFLLVNGQITSESLDKFYQEQKVTPENAVFVFPGNPGHHNKNQGGTLRANDVSLYSIKQGAGLAAIAKQEGEKNRPTWSLPTTSVRIKRKGLLRKKQMPVVAETAVADLWRAIGEGKDIVLPVREPLVRVKRHRIIFFRRREKIRYFPGTMNKLIYRIQEKDGRIFKYTVPFDKNRVEPSFWGGVNKKSNKFLADFYMDQLLLLRTYCYYLEKSAREQDADKKKIFRERICGILSIINPAFKTAYIEGLNQSKLEKSKRLNWYKPLNEWVEEVQHYQEPQTIDESHPDIVPEAIDDSVPDRVESKKKRFSSVKKPGCLRLSFFKRKHDKRTDALLTSGGSGSNYGATGKAPDAPGMSSGE